MNFFADHVQESKKALVPERVAEGTMAFMFETYIHLKATSWALATCGKLQPDYIEAWQGLAPHFTHANAAAAVTKSDEKEPAIGTKRKAKGSAAPPSKSAA